MQDQEQRQGRIDCEATGSVGVAGHGGVAERGIIASFTASGQSMRHCIHCGAERPLRWGRTKRGLQRWRCRGCLRSFCAVTGTAIERLHSLDGFAGVLADMLGPGPRSCRELAAAFAVGRMTIWRWRKLICRAFERGQSMPRTAFAEEAALVEEAVLVVRESRKASREWADHARDP